MIINTIIFFVVVALLMLWATVTFKRGCLRMMKDRTVISDSSEGAWTIEWGTMWLLHFGEAWRAKYGETGAFGIGTEDVWYFTPKERPSGNR